MAFEAKKPKYSGSGIGIWEAGDCNGKLYLKVKVLGGSVINCFLVEERKE